MGKTEMGDPGGAGARNQEGLAHVFLGLVVLSWGANFGIAKAAFQDLHPLVFAALRFSASAILVLLASLWMEGGLRIRKEDLAKVAIVGGLGLGGYQILWSLGLDRTYASNSALLFAAQPIFGALYLGLARREAVSRSGYFGMALATAGAALVILRPDARVGFSGDTLVGDLITLLACLCFAICFSAWAKPLLGKYSPLRLVGWCMVAGSLVLWAAALQPAVHMEWGRVGTSSWWALAYAVVFAGVLGHVCWYEGIGRIGVSRTLVYQYLVPVWAVAFNHIFLGESLFHQQVAGGILILWGVRKASQS
jgi:drug/metabolite transporter (DMT)-like permease